MEYGFCRCLKKYLPWLDGFAGSLNVIALVLGGLFVIQGRMTIGDLVAFNGFLDVEHADANEWLVDQ